MVVVSYSGKEINAKLVYYGAGLSGKTTNLESIYEAVPDTSRGKMVSMKTQSDRTLFFDLLPLDLGEIMGFKTRFLLYTVPGQVFYNATRKLVLKGADAIVFVADSEVGKMEENKDSLANLRANLAEYGLSLDNIPWVMQYNKRDLPNVYTLDELNAELNPGGKVPFFEAVAKDGKGVFETFRGISHLLMEKVTRDLRRGPMNATSSPVQKPAAVEEPAAPPAPGRPAGLHTPPAPPLSSAGVPPQAPGVGGVDYGREIELPDELSAPPAAAAPRKPATPAIEHSKPFVPPPAAAPAPAAARPPAAAPRPPAPAPRPAAKPAEKVEPVMAHAPARPAAGAPEAPAPHAARTQAHVAPVYDAATMPAPGVKSVSVDAMPSPANGSQSSSEEVVVPITLSGQGSHEIVLRIVLKIER